MRNILVERLLQKKFNLQAKLCSLKLVNVFDFKIDGKGTDYSSPTLSFYFLYY